MCFCSKKEKATLTTLVSWVLARCNARIKFSLLEKAFRIISARSRATCHGRLNYKKKHLQEDTAATGTAQNKSGVYFQEQERLECSRQEVEICQF